MQEKAQILVVEDHRSSSQMICAVLEDAGEMVAHPVFSGEEALKHLETQRPHLIMMDVMMPGITGFELCEQVKSNPRLKDIPVIFVTGQSDSGDIVKGLQLGAVDYVTKPIIPEVLVARVHAHLSISFHKEQLKALATTDPLTGLYNRKGFETALSESVEKEGEFGLIYLDLDHFKPVNDQMGHQAGDLLLQRVAKRLLSTVRTVDIVARIGGDEFVLMVNQVNSRAVVKQVCEKILRSVEAPYTIHGKEVKISATIGATLHPMDADSGHQLIRNADIAMYHAKAKGRNCYSIFSTELASLVSSKQQMEKEIRQGLADNQFELYYLPSVDQSDGTLLSMETLLRWNHPKRGLLSPDQFLDHFILAHLEEELFIYVVEQAVKQIKRWHHQGILDLHLTLNLTHAEFINRNLATSISEIVDNCECDPELARWIELDVSESYLMSDIEFSRKQINQLAKIGVTVSLDNFGTSCFSIYELQTMPLSQIKIDRDLIGGVGIPASEQILKTVINMIDSLGHLPAAVGVENQMQAAFLREHGCKVVQGYMFSEVLDIEQAETLMREKKSLI